MTFKNGHSQERLPLGIIVCLVGLRVVAVMVLAYGFNKAKVQISDLDIALTFTAHFLMFISYFFYAHSAIRQSWRLAGEKGKISYRDQESRPQIVKLLQTIAMMTLLQIVARFML